MLLADLFEKKTVKTSETAWVIVYTADKIILGKRSPTVKNPHQWNFFGGHVDEGESAADAAVRELEEECGLTVSKQSLKEITKIGEATYFCVRIENPSQVKTTDEVSKVKSFKLTDLPDNLHSKTENFFSRLDTLFA